MSHKFRQCNLNIYKNNNCNADKLCLIDTDRLSTLANCHFKVEFKH